MPAIESNQPTPQQATYGRDVLRYFLEQQADNPNFMQGIVNRIWKGLSDAEKDTISATQSIFFPDDLAARQKSTDAQLLADYIRNEALLIEQLAGSLANPEPPTDNEPDSGWGTA